MLRPLRLLPFLFASLLLAGCTEAPTFGRGGDPHQPYRKIVSLSPGTTEIVASYIANHQAFQGRTKADNFPPTVRDVPVVGDLKPDYEKLAQIKPDLIVYDDALYNEADVEKLKQLGGKLFAIKADTVAAFMDQLRDLGAEISSETQLNDYADKINYERQDAMGSALKPTPKVAVLMPGGGGEHMIAGKDSFQADLVRSGGGEPVGPPGNRFVTLNAESLISMNPDVILVAGMPDPIATDPRLKTLKAVVGHRVYGTGVDKNAQDILLRRGARVIDAIKFVASALRR
jgi:iron complex transport system substrate-binding protein